MSTTKLPRGKTGPITEHGKTISSRNAAKHNCTSQSLIVEGEDIRDFNALLEGLIAEYQPETEMQNITVQEAARAAWQLARINREFDKSQQKLYNAQPHMHEWDATQRAEFECMQRYLTRAQRAHARAFQQIEYLRKVRLQAEQRAFWENLQTERLSLSKQRLKLSTRRAEKEEKKAEAKSANDEKAKEKEKEEKEKEKEKGSQSLWPEQIVPLYQIVEIRMRDGEIYMNVHPAPEEMYRRADMMQPAAHVLRCFEFPDGIPAEYAWVNEPDIRHKGIVWEQTFPSLWTWRVHADWEAATAPGHFLPIRKPV
jgi:hypothetical protein